MKNELKEIRKELLLGVEDKDLHYILMQINKLDTLIFKLDKGAYKDLVCNINREFKKCNIHHQIQTGCLSCPLL